MTALPVVSLLSIIVFFPLLGGVAALLFGSRPELSRKLALGASLLELALVSAFFFMVLCVPSRFAGWLVTEDHSWIPALGIRYTLALDGVNLPLVMLAAFLAPICILVSWREVRARTGFFHFLVLASETAVIGVFTATDLALFYLFWELQVIPLFFLIGLFGHENRRAATIKFAIFTIAGSLPMLAAVIGLSAACAHATGVMTFALRDLAAVALPPGLRMALFCAFALAFAVKIPLVPIHTWLPDAHTQAPTAGSVILAGLLLKAGAYGLLRFGFGLFPEEARASATVLEALGLIGLFYGAWMAFTQPDMKRLIAASSIAHLGLVTVGIALATPLSATGAVYQMVAHGITTSALFVCVGMLSERTGSRDFASYGGLWGRMPLFSAFFLLFSMASMGLPGLSNFVGEILILVGGFRGNMLVGVLGFAGVLLTVFLILRMVQDALFGAPSAGAPGADLSGREMLVVAVLGAATLALGLVPGPVLRMIEAPLASGMWSPLARPF